jgi:hypothetical protein
MPMTHTSSGRNRHWPESIKVHNAAIILFACKHRDSPLKTHGIKIVYQVFQPGVDVMITIFGEKMVLFSKTNVMIKILV